MRNLRLMVDESYDFELLEETRGKEKELFIVGVFSSADTKNANGRIYRKPTLEREVARLQEEHLKPGIPLWGQLNHPTGPESDLEKVAIRTVALEWKGPHLYGKAKVLRGTPCGDIAATLLKEAKLGISSRGLGQVDEDGYVNDESYKLLCWDLVNNASNYPSWVNGIYEAKTFKIEEDGDQEAEAKALLEEVEKRRKEYFRKLSLMFEKWKSISEKNKVKE